MLIYRVVSVLLLAITFQLTAMAAPVGSAFTYQGRLNQAGSPASQPHDFEFKLFGSPDGADQIGATEARSNVGVNGGLFNVQLDFGAGAFGNEARYLQVSVKPSGSADGYTVLNPRQPIKPAPVALSVTEGSIKRSNLESSFSQYLSSYASSNYVRTHTQEVIFDTLEFANGISYIPEGAIVNETGIYQVSARIDLDFTAYPSGSSSVGVLVNGSHEATLWKHLSPEVGKYTVTGSQLLSLQAGDRVSLQLSLSPAVIVQGDIFKATTFDIVRVK